MEVHSGSLVGRSHRIARAEEVELGVVHQQGAGLGQEGEGLGPPLRMVGLVLDSVPGGQYNLGYSRFASCRKALFIL